MTSKAMIKFQIQIILQFYRTAKIMKKIKFVMAMAESFNKSRHFFNLHIFAYCFVFP